MKLVHVPVTKKAIIIENIFVDEAPGDQANQKSQEYDDVSSGFNV